jgi:hypothetical protein
MGVTNPTPVTTTLLSNEPLLATQGDVDGQLTLARTVEYLAAACGDPHKSPQWAAAISAN